jgi:Right handed beta helix region
MIACPAQATRHEGGSGMRHCISRSRTSPLVACFAVLPLATACRDGGAGGPDAPLEEDDRSTAAPCPEGRVLAPDGACMPVGIQGCAGLFMEGDGLCHPAMDRCPAGTIPKFDEGCVAVGIPGCAPPLLGEDERCSPAMARCPEGSFATPQEGCTPIDGPRGCGSGRFGDIPDDPGTVHVDLEYFAGGSDGSRARPLTSLAAALRLVEDGGAIALSDGTYGEPVVITRSLAILGRCASRVRLAGAALAGGDLPAVVSVVGAAEVTLRGVEIGGDGVGVAVTGPSLVTLERVHVRNAAHAGVLVEGAGAALSLSQSWIEGSRPAGESSGIGARAARGATLILASSAVTGNRAAGVEVEHAGSRLTLRGSLVEGTLPAETLALGVGVIVGGGAEASIEGSAIVGNRMAGVLATRGGVASLTGVLVEGTLPGPEGLSYGVGAHATSRSRLSIASSLLRGNAEVGIAVVGAGAEAAVAGSLVQDTVAPERGRLGGVGVLVARGAAMTLEDSIVWRNRGSGVHVGDASELTAARDLIEATVADPRFGEGSGVSVEGGSARLSGCAVRGNQGAGVSVAYAGSEARLAFSLVEGHLGSRLGHGVLIRGGARATLESDLIRESRSTGVFLIAEPPDGEVEVKGTLVQDTLGDVTEDGSGAGIVAAGYRLTLSSSLLRASRSAGLALFGATADVDGTVIDGVTGGGRGAGDTGLRDRLGDGVLSLGGSTARLTGVRVSGCARAGLLFDGSAGSLTGVRASGNLMGLAIQGSPGPTVAEGCVFTGNKEVDEIEDGRLPVPEAPPRLTGP